MVYNGNYFDDRFPWLAVTFVGSAGMTVCFILFFAINPVFSVICGVAAGKI